MVGFSVSLQLNNSFDEKPIIEFLNEHSKAFENDAKSKDGPIFAHKNTMNLSAFNFSSRYKIFREITDNFGMGLIILPSIVWQLGGSCSARTRTSIDGNGQFSSALSFQTNGNNSMSEFKPKDLVITIRIPLEQAEESERYSNFSQTRNLSD